MKKLTSSHRIKKFEKRQFVISILSLLAGCIFAVIINGFYLKLLAKENTNFLSRMVQIGDFREASLILQEAHLSNFKVIRYESKQIARSFVLPPDAELKKRNHFWDRIAYDSISVPVENSLSSGPPDSIIFEFEKFRLVPYALLAWLILNLVSIPQTRFMKKRLIEKFQEDLEIEKKMARLHIANEVRHNLRTPLAVLMRIPDMLGEASSNERQLLNLTIDQIRSLIAKLGDHPSSGHSILHEVNIYATLNQTAREIDLYVPKSVELEIHIDELVSSAFVAHIPCELRAIIGNLVTNSLEAFSGPGKITLKVSDLGKHLEISVLDSGRGIAPENLTRIFDREFSHGKKSGSGIGLFHAKEQVESWGGSITVDSQLEMGTEVKILLPIDERAKWYLANLKFSAQSKIYILEDQECMRDLWRMKLGQANLLERAQIASQIGDISHIWNMENPELATFLFDYDLGGTTSGLDILKNISAKATRCLLTGYFDDAELQKSCSEHGIFLLPKSQLVELPLLG